jgi:uncharacterized membrane protein YoaK (UPF0700 family)
MSEGKRKADWTLLVAMLVGVVVGSLFGDGWGEKILWGSVGLACGVAIWEGARLARGRHDA